MTKEELVKFLKENLQISIYDSSDYDEHTSLTVSISLSGEEISSSTECLYIR